MKTKTKRKNKKNLILGIIISVLAILNIVLAYCCITLSKEDKVTQEILYKETTDDYDAEEQYYSIIQYKKFKTLLKNDEVSTIAILDNSSNTQNKFLEMINKISYYKNTKIHLLEVSKLSKKNEISFYEVDERFKKLETNYIITVNQGKVLSITTFDSTKLNKIVEGIGE